MKTSGSDRDYTPRGLLLHDGLIFLALSVVTVALWAATSLLFHSFEAHREELGRRWSERGATALRQGKPEQAVVALRTALSYAPDERDDQMLLAQALASAGRTEEATSYFLTLWDVRPGDGFLNLQLARMARQKGDALHAINSYRAAIFGVWQGDGVTRRREVRLELADYLIERHDDAAARAELLIAAGNAPPDAGLAALLGDKFQAAGDAQDALASYQKAVTDGSHDRAPLAKAGRLAYAMGDYGNARRLLTQALRVRPDGPVDEKDRQEIATLAANADRLLELALARDLPARERASHLAAAGEIARKRLERCSPDPAASMQVQASIQSLRDAWKAAKSDRRELLTDATMQDSRTQLIYDTELETAQACGAPTGDDALLLLLAKASQQAARPE